MPNRPPYDATGHAELVFALVGALGTDVRTVTDVLARELRRYDYGHTVITLDDLLEDDGEHHPASSRDEALWQAVDARKALRDRKDRDDVLALRAISEIVAIRRDRSPTTASTADGPEHPAPLGRHAFVLRSLTTPDELETLRFVYGPRLVVIGAHSPRRRRLDQLAAEIRDAGHEPDPEQWTYRPEDLVDRDEQAERDGDQDVGGTFARADFFVRADAPDRIAADVARALAVLFGDPFRTPTRDETGLFHAAGAALRSAELGRQVGAAILDDRGSLLAVGTNEVPVRGGGSHWEDDGAGNRDFEVLGTDANRDQLDQLVAALASRIAGALAEEDVAPGDEVGARITRYYTDHLRHRLVRTLPSVLRQAGVEDLHAFGRAVHAEMHALLDAARRGVAVEGATVYSTTLPCHDCIRDLIGAGIERIVFVDAYARSRALDLHDDSITTEHEEEQDRRVLCEPFVGVAPRRYLELFDAAARERLGHIARQDRHGHRQTLDRATAGPVLVDATPEPLQPALPSYRTKELLAVEQLGGVDARNGDEDDEPGAGRR